MCFKSSELKQSKIEMQILCRCLWHFIDETRRQIAKEIQIKRYQWNRLPNHIDSDDISMENTDNCLDQTSCTQKMLFCLSTQSADHENGVRLGLDLEPSALIHSGRFLWKQNQDKCSFFHLSEARKNCISNIYSRRLLTRLANCLFFSFSFSHFNWTSKNVRRLDRIECSIAE